MLRKRKSEDYEMEFGCIVGFGVRRYCILARLLRYLGDLVMGVHPTGR